MAANRDSSTGKDKVPGHNKSNLCQPCLNKDKKSEAKMFCATCNEFQCMDCLEVHYSYAYMKGHKLVNANEAEDKHVSVDMMGLDRCNQHEEILKFICEDDNQLCCNTCAFVDHRNCNSVIGLQKVVGKSNKSSRLKVNMQRVKQKLERIINEIVSSKEKIDKDVKEIRIKVRRMRDEVIKMFDELEVSVVKDLKSFKKVELEKLTKKQSQNEKYLTFVQHCLNSLDIMYQKGTSVQQFIVEHKMNEETNDINTKVEAEFKGLDMVTINFDFDETLKLPPLPINDYVPGQLKVTSHLSESAKTIRSEITQMQLTPLISVDLIQSKDDIEEPLYTGIDCLPDGRLVAVDNQNKKCLVYNEKLQKIGSYKLSYMPLSVVAVSDQEIAITSGGGYILDVLRVDKCNKINLDRTYNVKSQYESICLKDGGHFVVGTIDDFSHVRFLSSTGEEKDFDIYFPNKTYPVGTSACAYIRNSNKVVITDKHEHTVSIYDLKTNSAVVVKDDQKKRFSLKWPYFLPSIVDPNTLRGPCGATVGPSDTILVCCENTNSIVLISQTGRILSSYNIDMKFPRKICLSPDKSFVVVTNACIGARKLQKLKINFI